MAPLFNFDDYWREIKGHENDPRMWSQSIDNRNPLMQFGRGLLQPMQEPPPETAFAGIPGTVGGVPRGQLPAIGPSMAQVHGGQSMGGMEAGQPAAPGFFDRLMGGLGANSNTLIGLGSDISRGGFSKGFAGALAGSGMDDKLRLSQLGSTDDIKEYNFARSQGYKGSLSDWMTMKRGGAGEFGLQPVYGTGPDGKPMITQLGKSGTAAQTKFPEGFTPSTGIEKVDLGTHWGLIDKRSGQVTGYMPKDVRGKEREEAIGTEEGKATVALPRVIANADRLLQQIEAVEKHPAKSTGTGAILGRSPGIAGEQLDFVERVDQLKGQAFLQAFETLKGGGAITEIEGKKGEQAIARLSRAKSTKDFDAALADLKSVVMAGINVARSKTGQAAPGAAPPGTGAVVPWDTYFGKK